MTAPRLAICLPTALDTRGALMLQRTVAALHAQTAPRDAFEVCIGVDDRVGSTPETVRAALPCDGLDVRIAIAPRTPGFEDVPHRNHARNAAWRVSSAPLCLMLDADFVLPPHAVEHIAGEFARLARAGTPAVLSPVLSQFGSVSTDQWFEGSNPWAWAADPSMFVEEMTGWPEIDRGTFSGFGELANGRHFMDAPAPESVSVGARMVEGMPVLPRAYLEACGGFDERYIGWGGDKISLVDVLRGLCRECVFDIRVVSSVIAMHQPHPTDPAHTGRLAHENERRRQHARMEIEGRTLAWRRQIPALAAAMHSGFRACVPGASVPALLDAHMADVLSAVVGALRGRLARQPGARVVTVGPHAAALARAVAGAGMPVAEEGATGPVVIAAVDAVDPAGAEDDRVIAGRLDAVRAEWGARVTGPASVVIAQRLLLDGPARLRVSDIQHRLTKTPIDARTIRAGGQTYALVTGRL